MKTPVKWVEPSITISKVAKIMRKQNIGALPILQDNALIGIVTRTDLLRTIQS
jgi:CBS domain-containing protein